MLKIYKNSPWPVYQSHKEVRAVKIKAIVFDDFVANETGRESNGTAQITPVNDDIPSFYVKADWVRRVKTLMRNHVLVGGYYVLYEDGYDSWSPAKAFEDGYTLIEEQKLTTTEVKLWQK